MTELEKLMSAYYNACDAHAAARIAYNAALSAQEKEQDR